jgi:hypothetical protein
MMLYLTIARGPQVTEATIILAVSDQGFIKGVLGCMDALAIDEHDCEDGRNEAATQGREEPETSGGGGRGPPTYPTH